MVLSKGIYMDNNGHDWSLDYKLLLFVILNIKNAVVIFYNTMVTTNFYVLAIADLI